MFYFTFIVITYYWKLQPYKFSQFQFIESFLVHMITFNICMNILPKPKIYIFIKFVPNFFSHAGLSYKLWNSCWWVFVSQWSAEGRREEIGSKGLAFINTPDIKEERSYILLWDDCASIISDLCCQVWAGGWNWVSLLNFLGRHAACSIGFSRDDSLLPFYF